MVLIDFWTYTCINCIRTFPYLKIWHSKYADDGLVIIGVHAPEFQFEHELENVQQAVKDYSIDWPVVQDNDFKTWRAPIVIATGPQSTSSIRMVLSDTLTSGKAPTKRPRDRSGTF